MKWLGSILAGVLAVLITTWTTGLLNPFLPPRARVWLALENLWRDSPPRPEAAYHRQREHVVLAVGLNQDGLRRNPARSTCSLVKLIDSLYFACVEFNTLNPAGLRVLNVRSPSFGAPATSTIPPKPILFLEEVSDEPR